MMNKELSSESIDSVESLFKKRPNNFDRSHSCYDSIMIIRGAAPYVNMARNKGFISCVRNN